MKRTFSRTLLISLIVVVACGKKNNATTTPSFSDPVVSPASDDAVKLSFALLPAEVSQCSEGGTLIATFEDLNRNNLLDDGESIVSQSIVCNGSSGQNGNDGANGSNTYFSVSQASPQQCAAGGVVYTSSQSGQSQPDITIICNGEAGQDAQFHMGPIGSRVTNKSYSACYHDYLFIPNSLEPDRGWLTFRHQSNGTQDRGIGSTGFQIWNVDIPNFSLASEVGNETFCTLNWNATSKVLNYTVTNNRDGLAGETGSIDLQN